MVIRDILEFLNDYAPFRYQESYDNSGLLVGSMLAEVSGILCTLDCTEEIIDEALNLNCNTILAHHPIIFSGLKSLTGKNYVERTVMKAIKNDINIIAYHTNLDNVINGVNAKIAEKLDLQSTRILTPKKQILSKLYTYVPPSHKQIVLDALFNAGAGEIGEYKNCSFQSKGVGTFKPSKNANPFVGEINRLHVEEELKVEVIFPSFLQNKILQQLKNVHPYEEVAFEIIQLQNENQEIGAGLIGKLEQPINALEFLKMLKNKMHLDLIKHTPLVKNEITKVAVCGGSGGFLLKDAIAAKADIFITADFKYHDYFNAENQIIIADIGHFESEQFTRDLLVDLLKGKFTTFAVHLSNVNTNPISYFK